MTSLIRLLNREGRRLNIPLETSHFANTDRDICEIKMVDEEHTQPMNDEIIRGILWETMVGGIDTVRFLIIQIKKFYTCIKLIK